MSTYRRYGIFYKPDHALGGTRVVTLKSLTEVGLWFSQCAEDERDRYEVRTRTVTYTAWVDYPAEREITDDSERAEFLFGRDREA